MVTMATDAANKSGAIKRRLKKITAQTKLNVLPYEYAGKGGLDNEAAAGIYPKGFPTHLVPS
jgi:hypothetical protein